MPIVNQHIEINSLYSETEKAIIEKCNQCYDIAKQKLGVEFVRPEINFKLRGRSAGTAHLQLNLIRFNSLLLHENAEEFLHQVVPHEICHLLCYQLYGKVKPHGKEWQSLMMTLFNVMPSTTHHFDLTVIKQKLFDYQCQCGIKKLSIRRHNKVQRQQMNYFCRQCKSALIYKSS